MDRCLQEINASTKLITEGQGKSGMGPARKTGAAWSSSNFVLNVLNVSSYFVVHIAPFGIFWILLAESQFDCAECDFEYDRLRQWAMGLKKVAQA